MLTAGTASGIREGVPSSSTYPDLPTKTVAQKARPSQVRSQPVVRFGLLIHQPTAFELDRTFLMRQNQLVQVRDCGINSQIVSCHLRSGGTSGFTVWCVTPMPLVPAPAASGLRVVEPLDELKNQFGGIFRLFNERNTPAAQLLDLLGARHTVGNHLAEPTGDEVVVIASDHLRGQLDVLQPRCD